MCTPGRRSQAELISCAHRLRLRRWHALASMPNAVGRAILERESWSTVAGQQSAADNGVDATQQASLKDDVTLRAAAARAT